MGGILSGGALGGASYFLSKGGKYAIPITVASTAIGALVGSGIGESLDKVDELYANMVLQQSLNNNGNGQTTNWTHPTKNFAMNVTPIATKGNCRNFETIVQSGGQQKTMRGLACKQDDEWNLKKVY